MSHENVVSSWDDYPVHQTAQFIRHVETSDRNFYDRYYFNMHGCSDELFAIFGFGQYPNLGVQDAFLAVRKGDDHYVVRSSRPITDRMDMRTGPLRVEVLEPLKRLRFVVEPSEHPLSMDITWNGVTPAIPEPNQYLRLAGKVIFDTQRLAQCGTWEGTLTVGGEQVAITPDRWWGTRDRSWGVRPVGEPEPEGIRTGLRALSGMWNYFPMQFDDHCIFYICHEEADGSRPLEQAERVWPDGRIEQLGRIEWEHEMQPGTRLMQRSVVRFPDAPGGPIEVRCESLLPHFFGIGSGYGLDADWRHGMYQGPETVTQSLHRKVSEIWQLGQFAVVDHVARFEYDGKVGYGLYEQAFIGEFPKVGLDSATGMAP